MLIQVHPFLLEWWAGTDASHTLRPILTETLVRADWTFP